MKMTKKHFMHIRLWYTKRCPYCGYFGPGWKDSGECPVCGETS